MRAFICVLCFTFVASLDSVGAAGKGFGGLKNGFFPAGTSVSGPPSPPRMAPLRGLHLLTEDGSLSNFFVTQDGTIACASGIPKSIRKCPKVLYDENRHPVFLNWQEGSVSREPITNPEFGPKDGDIIRHDGYRIAKVQGNEIYCDSEPEGSEGPKLYKMEDGDLVVSPRSNQIKSEYGAGHYLRPY